MKGDFLECFKDLVSWTTSKPPLFSHADVVDRHAAEMDPQLGPFLACAYYVARKRYYAVILCCRNSSNTAQHLLAEEMLRNFIPDKRKYFKSGPVEWPEIAR